MMRVIPATLMLVLLVIFVLWTGSHLEGHVRQMCDDLASAQKEAGTENWEKAMEKLEAMKKVWEHTRPFYHITLNQCSIDETDNYINRLIAAAGNQDKNSFSSDAASLKTFLLALEQSESLAWDTVF